jgi:hypothetical protein
MSFEQREGDFILFANTDKKNPKAPDRKGTALINGVVMEIAGWIKDGKNGKFLAGTIKPKTATRQQQPPRPTTPNNNW